MNIGDHFCMQLLQIILPPGTNVPESYGNGSDEDQVFPYTLLLTKLYTFEVLGFFLKDFFLKTNLQVIPLISYRGQFASFFLFSPRCFTVI